MEFSKIIVVTGKPGIFKVLNQSRVGYIVESLVDGKKMPISPTNKITSIEDIVVFTDADEIKLLDVFKKFKEHTKGEQAIDHKQDESEVKAYFEAVLPNYDKERVYFSDIKKMILWYNLLQKNNMLDFEEETEDVDNKQDKTSAENIGEKAKKPVAPKSKNNKAAEKKITAKKTLPQKTAKKV